MTGQQEMFPRHVGYGGKKAAEIVGISYRQLDYWARTDLVRPVPHRRRRQRQPSEVLLPGPARAQGRSRACSTAASASRRCGEAFTYLRNELGEDPASASLVISGDQVVLTRDGEEMIDLVRKGQGVLNVLAAVRAWSTRSTPRITELFPEGAPASAEGPPATVEAAAEQ